MRLLLTGITGFVGQNLVPMIVEHCPDIQILTMNIPKDVELAKKKYPYRQCTHISTEAFDEVSKFDPEIAMHLATITTEKNDREIIHPMLQANIEFGVLLLDTLRLCPSFRFFVNTGSFAEYRFGVHEINDAYLYTATKSAFRRFCDYYSQLAGFKYITVVPYTIYGGKPTVKRLMDYVIESMHSEKPVDMTAGEQILDFTHVNDLAGFYVYVLENLDMFYNQKNGEEFHIGTGHGMTIKEMASVVERIAGKKCNINWGGRPYRERDTMQAVAPIAKNLQLVKWRARISLEDGIRMMLKKN
jgi:CDP-paratose synthetase